MALVWQACVNGVDYQVRSAGRCLRLYSNGVFHSQYNPAQPLNGSLWDLLCLPALLCAHPQHARILVLGVGGGAVIRAMNHLLQPMLIIGIDINPVHLQIARNWFKADAHNTLLLQSDARRWLECYQGPPFDLIIDDLFGEVEGEPVRAFDMDRRWSELLRQHLSPSGVCVVNHESPPALSASYWLQQGRRRWRSVIALSSPLYQNQIGVYTSLPDSQHALLTAIERLPAAVRRLLRFELERLI